MRPRRLRQSFLEGLVEVGAADVEIDLAKNGLGERMECSEHLGGGAFGDVLKITGEGARVANLASTDGLRLTFLQRERRNANAPPPSESAVQILQWEQTGTIPITNGKKHSR